MDIRVHNIDYILIIETKIPRDETIKLIYDRETKKAVLYLYNNMMQVTYWTDYEIAKELFATLNKILENEKPKAYY